MTEIKKYEGGWYPNYRFINVEKIANVNDPNGPAQYNYNFNNGKLDQRASFYPLTVQAYDTNRLWMYNANKRQVVAFCYAIDNLFKELTTIGITRESLNDFLANRTGSKANSLIGFLEDNKQDKDFNWNNLYVEDRSITQEFYDTNMLQMSQFYDFLLIILSDLFNTYSDLNNQACYILQTYTNKPSKTGKFFMSIARLYQCIPSAMIDGKKKTFIDCAILPFSFVKKDSNFEMKSGETVLKISNLSIIVKNPGDGPNEPIIVAVSEVAVKNSYTDLMRDSDLPF